MQRNYKVQERKKSGADGGVKSKWQYANDLAILRRGMKMRQSCSSEVPVSILFTRVRIAMAILHQGALDRNFLVRFNNEFFF